MAATAQVSDGLFEQPSNHCDIQSPLSMFDLNARISNPELEIMRR